MECRRCISLDIKTTVVTSSDQSKVKDSGIDTSGRKSRKRWPHSLAAPRRSGNEQNIHEIVS